MAQLCVFRSSDFGTGKAGFLDAMSEGAVYDVDSDNGDCSYGNMYNVQNMGKAMAKCLGNEEVEIGAYRKSGDEYEYVSLDEMDATTHHETHSYDSLDAGFDVAIEARKKQQSFIDNALEMFSVRSVPLNDVGSMTVEQLINIGRELTKQQKSPQETPLTYDNDRALWVGKPNERSYSPSLKSGVPVFI
tara:strand:- start:352987 stop:353553 length:567 start_codon:yes stop_codon:yes gene_type:complete